MTSKVLKWLILLALVLMIVSFLSFWFGGSSFRDKDVSLEIEGPTQTAVGDEVVYKLKYSNDSKLELKNLNFNFSYPADSIVIKGGDVQNDLNERFEIEKLGSGEGGEREFRVFIVGNRGDTKTAKVDLSYKAGDLRSPFEKETTLNTTITSVPVSLTIVAPPNIIPGQAVDYILDYRNESGNAFQDLLFEFTYPEGFIPRDSTPNPSSGNNKWHLDTLKKGGAGRITIRGVLNGQENDTKTVAVSLKRRINDRYVDFQKASAFSVIGNPLLGLELLVNNSKNYTANPGAELNYAINYKNSSTHSLKSLVLTVKLDGDMYDLSSLNTQGGFFDSSSRTIMWGPSNINEFSDLKPGSSGKVNFYIKLKPASDLQGSNTLFVKSSARLSTSDVPEGVDGDEVSVSASLVTNISKQPTLTQAINPSNDGKYMIHWSIVNPGNALNNTIITATLPQGVSWDNVFYSNPSVPEPKFNNGKLTWNIGMINGSMSRYELQFQVSASPAGGSTELVKDVELSGTDSMTGQNIIIRP